VTRETLSAKPVKVPTLEELLPLDVEDLMLNPKFLRFMFTVFRDCGMYRGSFHSVAAASHWAEGRRSLGFDILRTLETHSGQDAHLRIMQEAQPKEAINDRRKHSSDYGADRNRELGGDDDGRPVDDSAGERYINYGQPSG
jgi:hypothetical protein